MNLSLENLIAKGVLTEETIDGVHELILPYWLVYTRPFDGAITDLKGLLPTGEGVDNEYDPDVTGNIRYKVTTKTCTLLQEVRDF